MVFKSISIVCLDKVASMSPHIIVYVVTHSQVDWLSYKVVRQRRESQFSIDFIVISDIEWWSCLSINEAVNICLIKLFCTASFTRWVHAHEF